MRTLLFVLLISVIAVLGSRRDQATRMAHEVRFQSWMQKYGKTYAAQTEYQTRLNNFIAATKKVAELNAESKILNSTATFELNFLADLSEAELKVRLGLTPNYKPTFDGEVASTQPEAPSSFDWRTKDKLTAVKDQGQCGSCWAFSCTESIESVYMISKNIGKSAMPALAPQQIVDCDRGDGGCNGGDLPTCYRYVVGAGLEKNSDYPYHARDQTCQASAGKDFLHIKGFKYVIPQGSKNENDMASYLAANSPMSIIVDASKWSYYRSGVMTAAQCGLSLDHAVQAIGYDTGAGYWIVRNSWGTSWGESGFIRLQFGHNTCGITSEVTVPTGLVSISIRNIPVV
jgi:C1A family cysteine protease